MAIEDVNLVIIVDIFANSFYNIYVKCFYRELEFCDQSCDYQTELFRPTADEVWLMMEDSYHHLM